jgi:hypothetical protein
MPDWSRAGSQVAVEGGYFGATARQREVAIDALARNTAALAEIEAETDRARWDR